MSSAFIRPLAAQRLADYLERFGNRAFTVRTLLD